MLLLFTGNTKKEGCDRETYSRLENEARLKSLGIWQVPGGIQRPWDYRRGRKAGSGFNNQPTGASKPGYSGSRYKCKQIGNWAKAQELLKQGHTYLDGDGDACEGFELKNLRLLLPKIDFFWMAQY